MTTGRKPTKTREIIDAEAILDQPRVANAMVAMQRDGHAEQQETAQSVFDLGRFVGAAMAANAISAMGKSVEIRAFEEIKKSKAFKHLRLSMPDGTFRPAENIDEFCRVTFGRGYKVMQEGAALLKELGEETFEAVQRLDINRAQLRLLIHLPEDSRAAVDEAVKSGAEKSEIVGLIQSLANQLDESKAREEELKGTIEANEKLLAYKSKQLDEAALIKAAPPNEQLEAMRADAMANMRDCRGALIGKFTDALVSIDEHSRAHGVEADLAFMAGLVGQLQADLTALRDRLGIPDITPALIPEWVSDPEFAAAGA